jgi:peptidoglycan hydrolase-like protein with peptidoglycan-binding domain
VTFLLEGAKVFVEGAGAKRKDVRKLWGPQSIRNARTSAPRMAWVPRTGRILAVDVSSLPSLLAGTAANIGVNRMNPRRGIIVGATVSLLGLTSIADLRAAEDRPASFDCSRDHSPLAVMVCGDRTLTAVERRTTVNYLAAYFSLEDESRTSFRNDHIKWLNGLTARCGLSPNPRQLTGEPPALSVECIRRLYTQRGDLYHKRLSGAALEESNLSPALLKKLQKRLADLKFLSGTVDGVFGADTRAAIKSYQASTGRTQSNFLTAQERNMLLASNGPPAATSLPKQAPVIAQQTPATTQQTPADTQQTPVTAPESASEAAPVQRSAAPDLQSTDRRPPEPGMTDRTAEQPAPQNPTEAANQPANTDSAAPADTDAEHQTRYFMAGAGLAVVILAFAAIFVFVRLRRRTKQAPQDHDVDQAFGIPANVSLKTEGFRPGASTAAAGSNAHGPIAAVTRDAQHVDADAPLAPERVVELLPQLEKGAKP